MIFTLGACVAGLLALLCLPAIARRAMRMARVAVERQMPISVDEIVAQRDLLRAEFATERRRLEQVLDEAREHQAREMRDSGRRLATIGRLSGDLTIMTGAHDAAAAAAALAERLLRETSTENSGLQKALYDADGHAEQLRGKLAGIREAHDALTRADAAKQAAVDRLSGDVADVSTRHEAAAHDLSQARRDLALAVARTEVLAAQVDNHQETIRAGQGTEAALRKQIAEVAHNDVSAADIDVLRKTIVEIGREVVRIAGEQRELLPSEPLSREILSRDVDDVRAPAAVN